MRTFLRDLLRDGYDGDGGKYVLGHSVTVPNVQTGQTASAPEDVVSADFIEEVDVTLQVTASFPNCQANILYVTGDARWQLPPQPLTANATKRVRIHARAIYVSVQYIGAAANYPANGITATGHLVPVCGDAMGDLLPQSTGVSATAPGASDTPIATAPGGTFLEIVGGVSNMGGNAQLFLHLLDGNALNVTGLTITGNAQYNGVPTIAMAGGGSGSGFTPAVPVALMQVGTVTVNAGGANYSGGATITFTPPGTPGGVTATGTPTIVGGAVTGVTFTNRGSGYRGNPGITVADSTGSGANLTCTLQVGSVAVVPTIAAPNASQGAGYVSAPNPTFSGGSPVAGQATATAQIAATGGVNGLLTPIGPITAPGPISFEDEARPYAFQFAAGMTWALSASQGAFTAVAGGAVAAAFTIKWANT